MKATGIIRRVDELGRIVLPIELRRNLDIAEKDELEIFLQDDTVVLRKYEPTCIFCGAAEKLITFRNKVICRNCVRSLQDHEDM